MALSQVQCLDDHHVNWRVSESKPEFFYSEDQRLAVEALISKGRDGFADTVRQSGVRDFLSEPELERILKTAEPYRPGHEHHQKPETPSTPGPGGQNPCAKEEVEDGEVSLQYWPDRSEASVAELDLGWPEAISYRGVTRVTVHTQPPVDGFTHIKEVVRKSIASAQRVIAVVMDVFTDVDIFRDLLDAGFKRKIPVYIILDTAAVPCFLSMCGRADMHRGHLKNLRVRCCGGVEFFTRSAQKVRGSLSQRFLLVDGDRAITGSYSFTWAASRLDRNLITVVSGQAVETFDLQFRELYLLSRGVSLSKVSMADEPTPDPVPQAAPVPVSAAVARKLINPKYALVTTGTSPAPSDQNSSNKNSQNPMGLKIPNRRLKGVIEEPPIHPGLRNLEKAYLIPYLPTWPEPDPPSDVIGFINIRDEKRAHQVHLQRSEMFEVSQAIRFKTPLTRPTETEEPAARQKANAAAEAEKPSGNTNKEATPPVSPTKQRKQRKSPSQEKDQTDVTDSRGPPQQPDTPATQETQQPNAPTPAPPPNVNAGSQPQDKVEQNPDVPQIISPPVPKRRTLQLVIEPDVSEQAGPPQVTLMKMEELESQDEFKSPPEFVMMNRGRLTSQKDDGRDSGSNEEGSQDSTKVICDRAVVENPSSASTASEEEFYDCSQNEPRDMLTNGQTTGSGQGHRYGDNFNVMARFSQSMLDLREPVNAPEDSANLIRQSQHLRRAAASPHRHIGQLFHASKSPGRDGRLTGHKVVLAKPGSFHRPSRPGAPVIGGHRYWQGQALHPDSAMLRSETRSGRSPRRHSPGYRKTGHGSPQPPTNPSGLLGMSFSKLGSLKHLRGRVGTTQRKPTQNYNINNNNKPAR